MHMEKTRLHGESVISQFDWPLLLELWQEATSKPRPSWYLPELVAMSFLDSCDEEIMSKLAAALGMAQLSIKLTDDLLDAEPGGVQERVSPGKVANLSNAFQAAAMATATTAYPHDDLSQFTVKTIASLCSETAYGQHLDQADTLTEEAYWTAVRWKSAPFYKYAFLLGGQFVQYDRLDVEGKPFYLLGELFGEIVQIIDDLKDIMAETPAVDWQRTNNLLVLFAEMTDEDSHFAKLKKQAQAKQQLEAAQQYLIDVGAVAYCEHVGEAKHEKAIEIMALMGVEEKRPLRKLFDSHMAALRH